MREIYNNGPVTATMLIYSDFSKQVANDGIYIQNSTTGGGGHSVILVGWGVRDGVKYWEVQNTYGSTWNTNGFFKIRRGSNDARIEREVSYSEVVGETSVPSIKII